VDFILRYDCVLTLRCEHGFSTPSHPWEAACYKAAATNARAKNENASSEELIKDEELDEIEDDKKDLELAKEAPLDSQKGLIFYF
jgi:hypothetical protein